MIRAVAMQGDGTPFVMLGLEPENIKRLQAGEPISVNLRQLDPAGPPVAELPDLDLILFYADEPGRRAFADVVNQMEDRFKGTAVT